MAKSKNQGDEPKEDAVMERMNEALKRMMETPHETQKEMIERRRRRGTNADKAKRSGKER